MSNDSFNDEFDDGRAAKPGMSTGVKVLIGVLVGGGLLSLLCCGGFVFFGYTMAKKAEIKAAPEEVRAVATQIATIDIPAEYEPQAAINMNVEMVGLTMAMAVFADGDEDAGVILMQVKIPEQELDQEQTQMQLDQQFVGIKDMYQQQSMGQYYFPEPLTGSESETRELTVQGEPVEFLFTKGHGSMTDQDMRQVEGTYSANGGRVRIIVQMPEEYYNEEEIVKMIESIQ